MTNGARAGGTQSFGADVKHELALVVPARECCQLSELRGIIAGSRSEVEGARLRVRLTLNAAVRKLVRLAHLLGVETSGEGHFRRGATRIRPTYRVAVPLEGRLANVGAGGPPPASDHCRRAFLRGSFLASGGASLTASGYHLELAVPAAEAAGVIADTMRALEIQPRTRRLRGSWTVYLKDADAIALLLAAIGASKAVLRFENVRILRDVRGQANRQTNTETANLRRSVATSLRQVDMAKRLAGSGVLEAQPPAIREIASLRMAMPSASLDQLAARLHLSKSAVNQRMRRLVQLAATAGLVD